MKFPISAIMLCLCLISAESFAQTALKLVPFSSGLTRAVDIVGGEDDRLYIVQQRGPVRIVDQRGVLLPDFFIDMRDQIDTAFGEVGMLSIAFHPNYDVNGYVFVSYTDTAGDTRIDRFNVNPVNLNEVDPTTQESIFYQEQPHQAHNGGDLAFGPDGYLYLGIGDGGPMGNPEGNAQDRTNALGTMIRINVDAGLPYTIPADNPFVGDPSTLDEIWALGLRNPWRWSFDRLTGDMWIADVGEDLREEVNFEASTSTGGNNYGWGCFEGTLPFDTCSFPDPHTLPVEEYSHDFLTGGISITGGFVYRGAANPNYYGKYIYCDFFSENFWTTEPDGLGGYTTTLLDLRALFISTFGEDNDGELYAMKIDSGIIYKVKQECSNLVQPVGLDAQPINPTKVSFYWDVVPGAVNYRLTGRALSGGPTRNVNLGAVNTLTVNVLTPGETYEWKMTARCADLSITNTSIPDTFTMPTMRTLALPELKIYPVPADDYVIVNYDAGENGTLNVFSLAGELMISEKVSGTSHQFSTAILEDGIYLIELENSIGSKTEKLTISH